MQNRPRTKQLYRPARLYLGKDCYVGFYAFSTETNCLIRVKHRRYAFNRTMQDHSTNDELITAIMMTLHDGDTRLKMLFPGMTSICSLSR